MNQLEERLRTAGRSGTDITPDLHSIRKRGLRIRRTRQVGTSLAAVGLVALGGVASLNFFRPLGETTIVSASDQPDPTDPARDGETTDDTNAAVDPTTATTAVLDEAEDYAEAIEVESGEGGSGGADATSTDDGPAMPTPGSVSDGAGGWLTATPRGVEHLRSDATIGIIEFPAPGGGFAQRWPTDVVFMDGGRYLLVDQFVNRQDLEAERVEALAETYGVDYDPELGAMGLAGSATAEELDSLNHWEVSILAVDLATDRVITVETRVINATHSPDWVYNGHLTSDGSNIMVMRELWQGHCLYAEGLTLTGDPVDIGDAKVYAKPRGLDIMTFDEVDAVLSMQADPPQPCRTLAELPDSGLGVWGTQADRTQMEAFRVAFFEAGLG